MNNCSSDYASAKSFGLGFFAYEKVLTLGWEAVGKGTLSSGPGDPLWRDPLNAKDVVTHAIPKANRWGVLKKSDEVVLQFFGNRGGDVTTGCCWSYWRRVDVWCYRERRRRDDERGSIIFTAAE